MLYFAEACECQAVYTGDVCWLPSSVIEDVQSCFKTLTCLRETAFTLEQEHRAYLRSLARETKYGSKWVFYFSIKILFYFRYNFVYYCKWWTTSTDFHTQHIHSREFYISWSGCMRLQLDWNERDCYHQDQSILLCVLIHTYCSVALQVHVSTFLFCCYILQSFILVVLKKSWIAFCMIVETINPLLFLKHIAATDFHSKLAAIHEY